MAGEGDGSEGFLQEQAAASPNHSLLCRGAEEAGVEWKRSWGSRHLGSYRTACSWAGTGRSLTSPVRFDLKSPKNLQDDNGPKPERANGPYLFPLAHETREQEQVALPSDKISCQFSRRKKKRNRKENTRLVLPRSTRGRGGSTSSFSAPAPVSSRLHRSPAGASPAVRLPAGGRDPLPHGPRS